MKKIAVVVLLALGFAILTPAANPSNHHQSCFAIDYFNSPGYECYTVYQCYAADGTRYHVVELEPCV